RSTARRWGSWEASQPVTSGSRVPPAWWSGSAGSTSSTWMRVGWARDLNRSALIRYSGSVARVGTENLLDLRILSSRQLRCCGEARTRGEPIAWVRTAVDLRTCAGPPRGAPMSFAIPEGLAPEVYPLAWLVGTWRGPGFIDYPGIGERAILTEATFSTDGGPYLLYTATTWELTNPPASLEGDIDVAGLQPRPAEDAAAPSAGSGDDQPARTELAVLLAEPSGHVSVYLGVAQGPRVQLATDLIARTATGAEMTAAQRMYGLVHSELMWATDL